MKIKIAIAILFGYSLGCCAFLCGQAPSPSPSSPPPAKVEPAKPAAAAADKPKAAPALSDAQRAAFFKAYSQLKDAQEAVDGTREGQVLKRYQSEFQREVEILSAACGADAVLQKNPAGDPECALRPKVAAIPPSPARTPEAKKP